MFSEFWWGWAFGVLCTCVGVAIVITGSFVRYRHDRNRRREWLDAQEWDETHG